MWCGEFNAGRLNVSTGDTRPGASGTEDIKTRKTKPYSLSFIF
jgi:hypothetical protein